MSHLFCQTKYIFVVLLGRGGPVHDISTSMPTPAAGYTVASQQRGHAAFDAGCLVLSGTVGPDRFNTQHQLLCVRFGDCVSDVEGTKECTRTKSQHSLRLMSVWKAACQSAG